MDNYLSLKDHVYNFITEEINKGNLKPEEKVNEQRISDILNVSRTPVREALIQLASDGFLENVPRKGFVIKGLSDQEARETYMILGALDGLAASTSCGKIGEKELKDMQFYIASMDLAIDSDNLDMYYRQQESFHQIYTDICGNESLIALLHRIKNKFLKKSYGVVYGDENMKEILHRTNEEHREIMKLFEREDGAGLERYLREVHWRVDWAYMETL